jgi:nitrite reductase/ring-hydroxylating ferredoxin subunit
MAERWIRVAGTGDVPPGQFIAIKVGEEEGLLHNVGGTFYCTGSICPHQGRSLVRGCLEGKEFTCPWHAWVFDVTTGESPYTLSQAIGRLPVRVDQGEVFVGLPAE